MPIIEPPLIAPEKDLGAIVPKAPYHPTSLRKFQIDRAALQQTLEKLGGAREKAALDWFWSWCNDRNLDRAAVGSLLQKGDGPETYSYDSIYQLLNGNRIDQGANIMPMIEAIEAFRLSVASHLPEGGLLDTKTRRDIHATLTRTMETGRVSFIFGNMASGKSVSGHDFCRMNPGAIMVGMPDGGRKSEFLRILARRCAVNLYYSANLLSEIVMDQFREGMLLVVDDADNAFGSGSGVAGVHTLNWIRDLREKRRCGVAFIMDHYGKQQMTKGKNALRLRRLFRRRLKELELPNVPCRADRALFSASVGLPPAPNEEIVLEFTGEDGRKHSFKQNPAWLEKDFLGRDDGGLMLWLDLLKAGQEDAKRRRKTFTWAFVLKAYAEFMSTEPEEED